MRQLNEDEKAVLTQYGEHSIFCSRCVEVELYDGETWQNTPWIDGERPLRSGLDKREILCGECARNEEIEAAQEEKEREFWQNEMEVSWIETRKKGIGGNEVKA